MIAASSRKYAGEVARVECADDAAEVVSGIAEGVRRLRAANRGRLPLRECDGVVADGELVRAIDYVERLVVGMVDVLGGPCTPGSETYS